MLTGHTTQALNTRMRTLTNVLTRLGTDDTGGTGGTGCLNKTGSVKDVGAEHQECARGFGILYS